MQYSSTEEKNDRLRSNLKLIYPREITRESTFKERCQIVKSLLAEFKKQCIEICPIFKNLFNRYFYTGSAFEGLQVKVPVEFDIDIVLKFPNVGYTLEESCPLSFCTLKLHTNSHDNLFPQFMQFFDENGYLSLQEVHSWLQSLIDKVILRSPNFNKPKEIEQILVTSSGPARTLKLCLGSVWLSVDLVPVFCMNRTSSLKSISIIKEIPSNIMSNFFLVPKPLKDLQTNENEDTTITRNSEKNRKWRIHFAEAELWLLEKRESLKPVIKLVKGLRDKEKWPIPSYFIKTVAFWIIKEHPEPEYFKECYLEIRFLEMLNHLQYCLEKKFLGHIFYTNFNLLQTLKLKDLTSIKNRIKKITADLSNNPKSVSAYFKCSKSQEIAKPSKLTNERKQKSKRIMEQRALTSRNSTG